MKENQFTYLQLVYSRVIHYPSLPISESPQRKFENSSIPIKKSTQKNPNSHYSSKSKENS